MIYCIKKSDGSFIKVKDSGVPRLYTQLRFAKCALSHLTKWEKMEGLSVEIYDGEED